MIALEKSSTCCLIPSSRESQQASSAVNKEPHMRRRKRLAIFFHLAHEPRLYHTNQPDNSPKIVLRASMRSNPIAYCDTITVLPKQPSWDCPTTFNTHMWRHHRDMQIHETSAINIQVKNTRSRSHCFSAHSAWNTRFRKSKLASTLRPQIKNRQAQ